MGIEDDDIASVRAATDIVAVISEHVGLKRVGRRWVGLCPFHSEKTPSFNVNQPRSSASGSCGITIGGRCSIANSASNIGFTIA